MRVTAVAKGISQRSGKPVAKSTYREQLRKLRERSGVSGQQLARSLGYASASGYFAYEQERQGERPIPREFVERLVPLLHNVGNPPITLDDLYALTDRTGGAVPKKLRVLDDKGLLIIRYRIEPGTYVKKHSLTRMFGASRIAPSLSYPVTEQFVAVDVSGDMLHCVEGAARIEDGKRCILAVQFDSTELVEIVVGKAVARGDRYGFFTPEGMPVNGEVIGVVIGCYSKE